MKVGIIKYNAGNIYSVVHGLQRLGVSPIVTDNPEVLKSSDCILFPGQGEAAKTMEYLHSTGLDNLITDLKQPVLGICIGMQLMCKHSEEGNTDCLGIFDLPVRKFIANSQEIKIPHMGWDNLQNLKTDLFKDLHEDSYVYFIHSYYVPKSTHTIASNNYTTEFSAALHKDNFYATQFHPEKSGKVGEIILKNFLEIAQNFKLC